MGTEAPAISAIAPWYGSNRMLAPEVGKALKGCEWVGVPFAGGMAEVFHIEARTVLVNDLHRHVINLAMILADPKKGPSLYRLLKRHPFHPETLAAAQENCAEWARSEWDGHPSLKAAHDYFISQWMGRSGKAGTRDEFKGNLPIRWNAGGGDSAKRYQSAVASINAWRRTLARCTFSTLDAFEFLAKCHDKPKHGIYVDPPFLDVGDKYKHAFRNRADQVEWHEKLYASLIGFAETRIVCRFYDHPLVRELYPEGNLWTWKSLEGGRTSANKEAPEVLIINGESHATE